MKKIVLAAILIATSVTTSAAYAVAEQVPIGYSAPVKVAEQVPIGYGIQPIA